MFRVIGIICNIFLVITFLIALLSLLFIFTQTAGIPFPPAFVNAIGYMLLPFIIGIRESLGGIHYSYIYGHRFETSFVLLAFAAMVLFILFLKLSSIFYSWDQGIKLFFVKLGRKFHLWRTERLKNEDDKTPSGKPLKPEAEAIVAFRLENIDRYPLLRKAIDSKIEFSSPGRWLFSQGDSMLLRFKTTTEAFLFIREFDSLFEHVSSNIFLVFDYPPGFRFAVHSIGNFNEINEEEDFIWGMLNCTALNQAYVSADAKLQFDMQNKKNEDEESLFKTIRIGKFSQLGNRTFPELYRLDYKKLDY